MTDWELPEIDLSGIDKLPDLSDNRESLGKLLGISNSLMWALSVELFNEEKRDQFHYLGKGKRNYTHKQKNYALSLIDTCGVRATARILQIPRRTIQRWCRRYGLFRGGVEDMVSGSDDAPYGCTIGQREDTDGGSSGSAEAIINFVS